MTDPTRWLVAAGVAALAVLALAAVPGRAAGPMGYGSSKVVTERGTKFIDYRPVPGIAALAPPEGGGAAAVQALPAPLTNTFKLHSRPGGHKVIYLDFDGHDGYEDNGTPYLAFSLDATTTTNFSDAELTRIQEVWMSVAEDFTPFDVDVTTEDPGIEGIVNRGGGDTRWGQRVVITKDPWDYSWAYTGTFGTDYECYAFTGDNSWIWIADSISHEVGHTLGLDEHGQNPGDGTYYEGHGSGNTYWAPIMGWTKMSAPYGLSQWDQGEYLNADHPEDSLNIITTQNGFGYRPDDHGSTPGTATPMVLPATNAGVAEGVIEQRTDVDYFFFTMASSGTVSLVINGDMHPSDASHRSSNLDVLAKIYNSGGAALYTSNPPNEIYASFTVALAAGTYYLSIDGTGLNNPTNGYSDYGSLGYYSITGSSTVGSAASPGIGGYSVYYGQVHGHTALSDGSGTPDQAYAYARDTAKLDFFSVADHCSYPYDGMMTVAEYQGLQATANSYNQDGTFVTFWGFEWTSDDTSWGGPATLLGKGHLTVINSTNFCRATDEASNDLDELVNWMSARDVVAFFNHPGEYGYNFDNFNFTYSDKIVGLELWNRSADYYGAGAWYHNALSKGWYIGAEGSGDNHSANWGTQNEWRMAILATNKTRATLFAAMKARRFYSSRDKNLALSLKGNGAEMGSKIPAGALTFRIEATDGDNETFTRVELVKNGTIVNIWTNGTTHPLVTNVTTGAQGDYFYAKVFQGASWTAISSPIFIIQAASSSNAYLVNLVPGAGTLSPAFASSTYSYAASVSIAVTSLTVTPTAADPNATITVNGSPVASGAPSDPISLNVGATTIATEVVSSDTTVTNTYTLIVTRSLTGSARWWDGGTTNIPANGNGASDGGNGTWDTTIRNWDQGTGLAHVAWNNASSDIAVFAGAAGTVTNQGVTVGGLTFTHTTGTYTLTNNTVTFGMAGTISNSAAATIGAAIAGTGPIAKDGAGTLTLSGANTYSGGTTLRAGTVALNAAAALGTGDVSVTGNSRFNTPGPNITYANNIDISAGKVLSIQILNPNGTAGASTFSGVVSGAGGITVVANGVNNNSDGTISLTNAGNTFTGPVTLPSSGNSADNFSFASIGDEPGAGAMTLGKSAYRAWFVYTGASNLTLNNRQLALSSSFGGYVQGNGQPINAFKNNGSGTVTFNSHMSVGAISAAGGAFWLGGSNTGSNTFAGIIPAQTSGGALGVGKWDAGKWILTGENTYPGPVTIAQGTLSVGTISARANAQPLGKGSLVQLGNQANSGTLEFTGSTNSSADRPFQIGNTTAGHTGGGIILNHGAGSLTFTAGIFNNPIAGITATRTLTLGGSYNGGNGANEIQGVIQNNTPTGRIDLTVSGSSWTLSGANTYGGPTTVSNGTLLVNGSVGTNAVTVIGGTLGGTGTIGGNVNCAAGGSLAPGASAGTLSIGGSLNISAQAAGTGKLYFELDATNASDKIVVTGTNTVGAGALGFGDFVFTNLGGLQNGTYKLITSDTLIGSLDGADLSGAIGALTGTVQITGNDLELVVTGGGGCVTPTAFNVTGGGAYCAGDPGVAVGLDGSESGVDYQLYRSGGATAVGSPVAGTGSAISLGTQTVADTYTVVGTRTAGGCTNSMTGSAPVTVSTPATANAGPDQSVGHNDPVTLAGAIGGSASSASWSGGGGSYAPDSNTLSAVYTPSKAEKIAGTVTLRLTTDDPGGPCGPAADSVTIKLTNTPPVASNFALGVPQGSTATVAIIGGAYPPSDADGDPLTVTAADLVTPANGGSVSVVGGTAVTYIASGSFSGTDSFTYVVSDGFGGSDTGMVTVVVSPAAGGLNITGISVTGVTVRVTAQGVLGATYRLQYTDSLSPVSWQAVVGSDQVAGTNGVMTLLHTDNGAVPPVRYYSTLHVSGP